MYFPNASNITACNIIQSHQSQMKKCIIYVQYSFLTGYKPSRESKSAYISLFVSYAGFIKFVAVEREY